MKNFSISNAKKAFSLMIGSRLFEEKTDYIFKNKLAHGTTHLSIGQEAAQAGLCLALEKGDWFVPTHRCHGFTYCSGSDPTAMFSEILGSKYGLAKGMGGSMHMPDKEHGNLGSSAIVGSGVPLATGLAFALKHYKKNNISVAIFGDGASSRGTIHESMNIAKVWKLPVLFFCENNSYGMSAPVQKVVGITEIYKRKDAYEMEGEKIDGNDVEEVYNAVSKARNYILDTGLPYFIELATYRLCGHSLHDKRLYRTRDEEEKWQKKCPIIKLKNYLLEKGVNKTEIEELEKTEQQKIEQAFSKALETEKEILTEEEMLNLVYPGGKNDL